MSDGDAGGDHYGEPPRTEPPAPASTPGPIKPLPGAVAFAGMGLSAAVCVAVGVVLGVVVDDRLHSSPAFLVVGLVLGLAAAVGTVVGQVRRFL